MSLYRAYRPKQLSDVVGQEHITNTLAQAIEQKQLSHAYLFAGVRGTGKTSTARILAGILLTEGIEDEAIKRQIIQGMEEGNLVDLIEIDAASNRGIDDIRGLIEKIQFTPVVAHAKVYIIDEVHMLTREAFNALLKTLEEPPEYAYFILATTELHKIPATIQSRCQRFLFRHISEDHLVSRLRFIAESEKISVEDAALRLIAHHVQGGMRDAISLLDQLRSLPSITADSVKERVGESGHEHASVLLQAIDQGDTATIIKTVHTLEEAGVPLEHFVRLLLRDVRSAMHEAVKARRSPARETRMMSTLLEAAKDLRSAPVQGLVLEAALLSLCDLPAAVSSAPAPIPVVQTERRSVSTPDSASHPIIPTPPAAAPIERVTPLATPQGLSLESIRAAWPSIVETVNPPSAKMSLKNGHVHALEGTSVIIRFSSPFHRDKASAGDVIRIANDALSAAIGSPVRLQYILDSDINSPAPLPESDQVDLASAALDLF